MKEVGGGRKPIDREENQVSLSFSHSSCPDKQPSTAQRSRAAGAWSVGGEDFHEDDVLIRPG